MQSNYEIILNSMTKAHFKYGFWSKEIISVKIIQEGAFGGTYFRNIYSGINDKWYKKSWKKFDELKDIDQKYYFSNCYDVSVNKYKVKCGTSLRIWENKGWTNLDMVGILDIG